MVPLERWSCFVTLWILLATLSSLSEISQWYYYLCPLLFVKDNEFNPAALHAFLPICVLNCLYILLPSR